MAREVNRLSARRIQTLKEAGRHADGGGLYLVVDDGGAKRWVMLYRFAGKRREMGLGSTLAVPLGWARELAAEARAMIASGRDPIAARQRTPPTEPIKVVTFADVAETFMADRETTWKNAAHRRQWRQTLEEQAAILWVKPVAAIDTAAVLALLRPMWQPKAETARRLRGRIERILDAARAAGFRTGENPARWRGHLDVILPAARKLTRGHHAALPYRDAPAFMAAIHERPASAARMLEVLILCASRSGEVRGMTWDEVDLAAALWVIPKERMKGKREHRVPLCSRALTILSALKPGAPKALVFPNGKGTSTAPWCSRHC